MSACFFAYVTLEFSHDDHSFSCYSTLEIEKELHEKSIEINAA